MGLIIFVEISSANSALRRSCTEFAYAFLTQNEIVYSEDDCVIRRIEIPALLTAENMRAAIPFRPFIPEPLTEIIAPSLRQLIPRTGPASFSLSKGPFPILVPRADGLCELRLHASIPFAARGARVLG